MYKEGKGLILRKHGILETNELPEKENPQKIDEFLKLKLTFYAEICIVFIPKQ
jgi:hypothetical protein